MTDILDKLRTAKGDDTQATGTLLKEAGDEIVRLRAENKQIKLKLEGYQRLSEPEF